MDVDDQIPDNEYMQDPSTDNILSKYNNQTTIQTQQSIVIPDSVSNTHLLAKNNMLLDTDELEYTQYFDHVLITNSLLKSIKIE